ncbi:ral guanine nucleotide dissociation stimulator-like [Chionomys nivalis]|uniref:ral guanine nucleotide dissociation stimulator-like n=1 Tax=Chionomys nivalis TaxID=269649 RepID=UPI0025938552|nr:ral guanine nucleotide dissociation stimulator-like [Chionomys nivalis]
MFSHVKTSDGSGHQKAKSRGLGHLLRCWNQKELYKPLTFNTNSPDYVEIFISCLPRAFKQQDTACIYLFLAIYQKFSTTWEVLDLIIKMYGSFRPDCVEDQEKKTAILWFLSLWLRKHPQDFCDYPDMATVKRLVDYIRLNAPSTEVVMQTEELLSMLREQEFKTGEEAWVFYYSKRKGDHSTLGDNRAPELTGPPIVSTGGHCIQ